MSIPIQSKKSTQNAYCKQITRQNILYSDECIIMSVICKMTSGIGPPQKMSLPLICLFVVLRRVQQPGSYCDG